MGRDSINQRLEDVISIPIKFKKINLPLVDTDYFFIHDLLYFTVNEILKDRVNNNGYYKEVDYDYLESILGYGDIENIGLIQETISKEANRIANLEEFDFLTGLKGVQNVYYRYENTEKYVRFFILHTRV